MWVGFSDRLHWTDGLNEVAKSGQLNNKHTVGRWFLYIPVIGKGRHSLSQPAALSQFPVHLYRLAAHLLFGKACLNILNSGGVELLPRLCIQC